MYHGSAVPVTIRKQPSATPTATPTATAIRRPQAPTAPPDTCSAFSATAMISSGAKAVMAVTST